MLTTPRWGLRYPQGSGDSPDVPLWMSRLATDLDSVAMDDQGTLALRPNPGTGAGQARKGFYYYATDTGQLFRSTGSEWVQVALAPLAQALAGGSTSSSSYSTIATTSFVVPATGTYEVELNAYLFSTTGSPSLGFRQGAAAVDSAKALVSGVTGGVWSIRKVESALTGGLAIDLQASNGGGGSVTITSPRISIRRLS